MKYIATILTLLLANVAFAQDFYDALRYSQTEYGGTARSIAMGSAFGAVGGDFISSSINPAGIGLYRSGEFTLSPTLNMNQVDASYLDNNESDNKYNFNLNNISYVATLGTGVESGIVSINFGVGYNRLKNFHSNRFIQGYDANTTLLNYYTDYANDIMNPDNFDYFHEGLAWNTWLMDEDPDTEVIEGVFYNDLTNYEPCEIYDENNNYLGIGYEATGVKPHQQKALISNSGRIDEYLMSLGLNFNHKIYVGASVGLNDLQFSQDILYSEIDNNNQSPYLNNYTVNHQMDESGFGVNFKAGVIFRPIKSLRLGAAIHTPTFYTISRYSYKQITSNFDQAVGTEGNTSTSWTDETDMEPYDYKLETPLKANISAAYILGSKAILSADYEITSYNSMKFRDAGDNWDYSPNNSDINNVYHTTGTLRLGAEVRATPNFSLRAGYNLLGNPWNSSYTYEDGTEESLLNNNDTFSSYSAGLGYRNNNFFIDFAYRLNHSEYAYKVHEIYYTNPSGGTATATLTELNHQATLTLGFRF